MIATTLAARARGLTTRLCGDDALGEIDRAPDAAALTAALIRAGYLAPGPAAIAAPAVIERAALARSRTDLATLVRWAGPAAAALALLGLDEDRRTLRGVVRGLAAGAPRDRRLDSAVATATLPRAVIEAIVALPSLGEIAAFLARRDHPFAAALVIGPAPRRGAPGAAPVGAAIDLLAIELALAHAFAACARAASGRCAGALATHVGQILDAENAAAALLLAARGDGLAPARAFLAGGARLDRATFLAAATAPPDDAPAALAAAFARTPLAEALAAARTQPAALDDAALAWQIATQARLRIAEPHGLAPVLYLVLRRRAEARRVRRAAWRVALAGGRS
jgi:hypothetical protein